MTIEGMPRLVIHDDGSPLRIDEGGAVRVGLCRITLDFVVESYKAGMSPESVVERFPTLQLADV